MSELIRTCPDCDEPSRREFLRVVGSSAAAAAIAGTAPGLLLAEEKKDAKTPETLVKQLYDSLNERQRKEVCFDWDYQDPERGLLRTRISNNWHITKPVVYSEYYTGNQQEMVRAIWEGLIQPDCRSASTSNCSTMPAGSASSRISPSSANRETASLNWS